MSLGPACGLWWTRRGLLGAVVDANGELMAGDRVPTDDRERAHWLGAIAAHHGRVLEMVLVDSLEWEPLIPLAQELGHHVWLVSRELALAVAHAAWWRPTPLQIAGMLARFPRVTALRRRLRRAPPWRARAQLRFVWSMDSDRMDKPW